MNKLEDISTEWFTFCRFYDIIFIVAILLQYRKGGHHYVTEEITRRDTR